MAFQQPAFHLSGQCRWPTGQRHHSIMSRPTFLRSSLFYGQAAPSAGCRHAVGGL